jgi:hypothetical protein
MLIIDPCGIFLWSLHHRELKNDEPLYTGFSLLIVSSHHVSDV